MTVAGEAFGGYVHIPFCAARCDYCAFATWTDRDHLIEGYLGALRTEISQAVAGRASGAHERVLRRRDALAGSR